MHKSRGHRASHDHTNSVESRSAMKARLWRPAAASRLCLQPLCSRAQPCANTYQSKNTAAQNNRIRHKQLSVLTAAIGDATVADAERRCRATHTTGRDPQRPQNCPRPSAATDTHAFTANSTARRRVQRTQQLRHRSHSWRGGPACRQEAAAAQCYAEISAT